MQQQTTPRMRYQGNGVWVCESSSQPGVGHLCNPTTGRCSCTAGKFGKPCKHLRMARQAEAWRVQTAQAPAPAPAVSRPAGMAALLEAFGA